VQNRIGGTRCEKGMILETEGGGINPESEERSIPSPDYS